MPYYAVANGRNAGIYDNWSDCKDQVNGYSGASFKKFDSSYEAEAFVNGGGSSYGGYGGSSSRSSNNYGHSSRSSYSRSNNSGDDYYDVYTDGACVNNGQRGARAGIGAYFGPDSSMNISKPLEGRATNNRAEIRAATEAAKQAQRAGIEKLRINTDSEFVKKSINDWMPNWKQNGWKKANGEPVVNKEDFQELDRALKPLDVKWKHVPSHSGIRGNEMADRLAKEGASKHRY